jgi:SAM-dependent methyltransferase
MQSGDLRGKRDAIAATHGPWLGMNIKFGKDLYTVEQGTVGTAEFMVHRLTQALADVVGSLEGKRVLDLGCHEGGYAIELGLHGASVVGIEGREAHAVKGRFVAESLRLGNVSVVEGDVRDATAERYGTFDIVLCLGILYHLGAHDAVRLLEQVAALTERAAAFTFAVGLGPNVSTEIDGHLYRGRRYSEDQQRPGASIGNDISVLPTRESVLNILADLGFTSVLEVLSPPVPGLELVRDSTTLIALKGASLEYNSLPEMNGLIGQLRWRERRRPGWPTWVANPQQGLWWQLRERVRHDFVKAVFQSRRPPTDWL